MEIAIFNVLFVAALFVPPLAVVCGGLLLAWPARARRQQTTTSKPAIPATL